MSKFKYLGFIFTCQLSFSEHLESKNIQANIKLGQIYNKMKSFNNISLDMALDLYNCYILPTYLYGLPIWIRKCSKKSMDKMNSNFTKFLKRYLGVWYQQLQEHQYSKSNVKTVYIDIVKKAFIVCRRKESSA